MNTITSFKSKENATIHPRPCRGRGTLVGKGRNYITPEDEYTDEMKISVDFFSELSKRLFGFEWTMRVVYLKKGFAAIHLGSEIHWNLFRLGRKWFGEGSALEAKIDLFVHEAAHEIESNHLVDKYNEACTQLGARVAVLALMEPEFFEAVKEISKPSEPFS